MKASFVENVAKRMKTLITQLKQRINLFYLLAFIPLAAIAYYSVIRAVIPVYSFILLLLKKDKLSRYGEPSLVQRVLGGIVLVFSLFAYYVVVLVLPQLADPYGIPNYTIHLLGLFLVFFSIPALKDAFSPLFLIIASTSSFFLSEFLEPFLSPFLVPLFMRVIEVMLGILRLPANVDYSTGMITLRTQTAYIPTMFVWGCIGVFSTMLFSIILITVLVEEKSSRRTKFVWSVVGIFGTNVVNVIRVIAIYLTDYYVGYEAGAQVHYFIGYVLFIAWLTIFFYAMSRKSLRKAKTSPSLTEEVRNRTTKSS
jgi:exosortase/archaeosortase family protein